jgi:hypothetical protein
MLCFFASLGHLSCGSGARTRVCSQPRAMLSTRAACARPPDAETSPGEWDRGAHEPGARGRWHARPALRVRRPFGGTRLCVPRLHRPRADPEHSHRCQHEVVGRSLRSARRLDCPLTGTSLADGLARQISLGSEICARSVRLHSRTVIRPCCILLGGVAPNAPLDLCLGVQDLQAFYKYIYRTCR